MFDKLEDLLIRFEEIMSELNEPTVANNQERFRKLMKEQSDLTPIVEAFKEYIEKNIPNNNIIHINFNLSKYDELKEYLRTGQFPNNIAVATNSWLSFSYPI